MSSSAPPRGGPRRNRVYGWLWASLIGLLALVVLGVALFYHFGCAWASADSGGDACGVLLPVLYLAVLVLAIVAIGVARRPEFEGPDAAGGSTSSPIDALAADRPRWHVAASSISDLANTTAALGVDGPALVVAAGYTRRLVPIEDVTCRIEEGALVVDSPGSLRLRLVPLDGQDIAESAVALGLTLTA